MILCPITIKLKTMIKKTLLFISICFVLATGLFAQQNITGKVLDENNEPLIGVNVVIKGTSEGTVTDINGEFTINVAPESTITISFLGYITKEIAVGDQTNIEVALSPDLMSLKEVVVTALGIKRDKKALGYSVQDVKAEELNQTGDGNITSALQGKVSGVTINSSGAGLGGTSRIEIRGASSLTDNNSPLVVVDGVPFFSEDGNEAGIWGGIERSGGIEDIDPDNIESVSLLKGPNAAALYGSRAGNGVIMITTKKGKKGATQINYNGSITVSKISHTLDLQDEFGQGRKGIYDKNEIVSWGPKMEGQLLESWTGNEIPYSPQTNRLEEFCQNAISQKHNLSLSTGTENGTLRVALGRSDEEGIYKGHTQDKTNFDLRADYNLSKWLNLDVKASYYLTEGSHRPEMGNYSYVSFMNTIPMNIRSEDLEPGYTIAANGNHVEKLYFTPNANLRNPYFLQEQFYNEDKRHRGFGYFGASVSFTPNLKVKVKHGLDFYTERVLTGYKFGDVVDANRPNYNISTAFNQEQNTEFLLSFNKELSEFSVSLNAGGNRMNRKLQKLSSNSGLIPEEGNLFLDYGTTKNTTESFVEEEVQSIYGFGQIGFREMIYLDITARNDWSSTLPVEENSYFYPSVSLSAIISEMISMPNWLSYAKVRGSFAQVGKGASPNSIDESFTIRSWNYDLLIGDLPNYRVNKDLKPEISNSTEFGVDIRFLENRLGLDFTVYNENTKNQILPVEIDNTSGYTTKIINAGLINNKGVEVLLNTTPVKTKDFTLNINFNFAKNTTKVEALDDKLKEYSFGGLGGAEIVAIEGEKMGDIKGTRYSYNEAGQLLVDGDGLPMPTDSAVVIGNIQPDFTGGVSITADYKGFFVNALISMQQGGDIFSVSEQNATAVGTAKRTAENGRIPYFVDGVTTDGNQNDVMAYPDQYWNAVSGISEEFIYDASYMKLREIAIGYNLPSSILSRIPGEPIKRAKFSLVGRNLLYLYKYTPGTVPDASAYTNSYAAQAFDFSPVPATRTFGFSLNLGF